MTSAKMKYKNKFAEEAFAKYTPSVFIVGSPLQLLCAIEAIREFKIETYYFVFTLDYEAPRNQQIFEMAEYYNLKSYDIHWLRIEPYRDVPNVIKSIGQKFARIFIGDYYMTYCHYLAEQYAKPNSIIIYVDDGMSSILCFNGLGKIHKPTNWRKRLNWYRNRIVGRSKLIKELERKQIYDSNCFFTLFSDIETKHFALYPNTFRHLLESSKLDGGKREDVVIIIGLAISVQADELLRIPEYEIESIVWNNLSEIKQSYPSTRIVYIPHGRDNNNNVPQFCSMLGIEYMRLNEPIESFMIKSDMNPLALYGFGSSALLTLHRFFSSAKAVNWKFVTTKKGSLDKIDKTIKKYYEKSGIIEKKILLKKGGGENTGKSQFIENILSLWELLRDKMTGYKYKK